MERALSWVSLAVLATASFCLAVPSADSPFKAAEAVSATDAFSILFYTTNWPTPDAFVVLDLCLSSKGSVKKAEVLRDPVSMGNIAASSVRPWKFRPASEEGEAVASQVPVVFVYRPANTSSIGLPHALEPINLKPARTERPCADKDQDPNYMPARIAAAAYPDYPVNSVAWGSVVIQVTVDAAGKIADTEVLHPMASFTPFALEALKFWRFRPALLRDRPVDSNVLIAFVFQTPSSSY